MRFWFVICKTLGYVWLFLAGAVILVGIAGVWMKEGLSAVQALLSPFNIWNWLATVITLAPGIGLLMLADKLQAKQRHPH